MFYLLNLILIFRRDPWRASESYLAPGHWEAKRPASPCRKRFGRLSLRARSWTISRGSIQNIIFKCFNKRAFSHTVMPAWLSDYGSDTVSSIINSDRWSCRRPRSVEYG